MHLESHLQMLEQRRRMHGVASCVHLEGLQQRLVRLPEPPLGFEGLRQAFRSAAEQRAPRPHGGRVQLVRLLILTRCISKAAHVVQAAGHGAVELRDGHRVVRLVLLEFRQGLLQHRKCLVVLALVFLCNAQVPMVFSSRNSSLQVHGLQEPRLGLFVLPQLVVHRAQVDESCWVWRRFAGEFLQELGGVGLSVLLAAERRHVLDALHVPRQASTTALSDAAAIDRIRLVELVALHARERQVQSGGQQLRASQSIWILGRHLLKLLREILQDALVLFLAVFELVLGPHEVLFAKHRVIQDLLLARPGHRGYQLPSAHRLLRWIRQLLTALLGLARGPGHHRQWRLLQRHTGRWSRGPRRRRGLRRCRQRRGPRRRCRPRRCRRRRRRRRRLRRGLPLHGRRPESATEL
mmetsp:Transcript_92886/g.266244  ORF Transcript_92886/g.266244 Transcript_92886/m.266244 type:complete len:408 (-) Transcript_92886:834-2057(-)